MATKKKKFSMKKEVKKLARERVGPVPAERVIPAKTRPAKGSLAVGRGRKHKPAQADLPRHVADVSSE